MKTLLAVLILAMATFAFDRATWTGRSQEVRTITGGYAVNCEYSTFSGKKFWKVYATKCEQYVDVY